MNLDKSRVRYSRRIKEKEEDTKCILFAWLRRLPRGVFYDYTVGRGKEGLSINVTNDLI